MSEIDRLAKSIMERAEGARQAQIRFAECVSVDWDNKTMIAKGTGDDVEYLDVTLGYGFWDTKPKEGAACLIGIIEGQEVVSFLIDVEEVELVDIRAEKIIFNEGKNGGIPISPELAKRLNTIEKDLNTAKAIFAAWSPIPSDGGAALKATIATWSGQQIPITKQSDIEDLKIKH